MKKKKVATTASSKLEDQSLTNQLRRAEEKSRIKRPATPDLLGPRWVHPDDPIESLTRRVEALEEQVAAMATQIAELDTKVEQLRMKNQLQ